MRFPIGIRIDMRAGIPKCDRCHIKMEERTLGREKLGRVYVCSKHDRPRVKFVGHPQLDYKKLDGLRVLIHDLRKDKDKIAAIGKMELFKLCKDAGIIKDFKTFEKYLAVLLIGEDYAFIRQAEQVNTKTHYGVTHAQPVTYLIMPSTQVPMNTTFIDNVMTDIHKTFYTLKEQTP